MASAYRTGNQRIQTRQRADHGYTATYIDGNVVRHIQEMPQRSPRRDSQKTARTEIRKNREKALHISMSYVMFLTAASIATVFLCVNYLKLQAQGTSYRNEIAALESKLSTAKYANDNNYEEAISSVNMEEVKEIAINQLGMVYAGEGQIIRYSNQEGDYIRQYAEIPEE